MAKTILRFNIGRYFGCESTDVAKVSSKGLGHYPTWPSTNTLCPKVRIIPWPVSLTPPKNLIPTKTQPQPRSKWPLEPASATRAFEMSARVRLGATLAPAAIYACPCRDIRTRVKRAWFTRNHKYPDKTPTVLLLTMIYSAGTCTSTRQVPARNPQGVVFTNNYWPGYLLQSKSLKEFNI